MSRRSRVIKPEPFKVALRAIDRLRAHTVAVMVKPTFTAIQLADMVFTREAVLALRNAAPYYDEGGHYSNREFLLSVGAPNGVRTYIELNYEQARIARPREGCVRSVLDAPELIAAFRETYEIQVTWLKVKTVVKWFEENASLATTRGIWPVIDILAGATDEPPHKHRLTKLPIGPMLGMIRETGATVAASALLPAVTTSSHPAYTLGIDDLEYPFDDPTT